jgi:hypothetical protein
MFLCCLLADDVNNVEIHNLIHICDTTMPLVFQTLNIFINGTQNSFKLKLILLIILMNKLMHEIRNLKIILKISNSFQTKFG